MNRILGDVKALNNGDFKQFDTSEVIKVIHRIIGNGMQTDAAKKLCEIYFNGWTLLINNSFSTPMDLTWNNNEIGITIHESAMREIKIGFNEMREIGKKK
eukprot:406928_1